MFGIRKWWFFPKENQCFHSVHEGRSRCLEEKRKQNKMISLRVSPHKDQIAKPNSHETFFYSPFSVILRGCDLERLSNLAVNLIMPFT